MTGDRIRSIGAMAALAVFYSLFFNAGATFILSGALLFSAFYLLLLPLFSLGIFTTILTALIFAADIVTLKTYGNSLNLGSLAAIMETTPGEADELLHIIPPAAYAWGLSWAVVFVVITHAVILRPRPAGRWRRKAVAAGLALAVGLFALLFVRARQQHGAEQTLGEMAVNFAERNTLSRIAYFGARYGQERRLLNHLGGEVDWGRIDRAPIERETVFVVVGEAVRRDHLSLYGYGRKTTPYLDAIRPELIVFEHPVSPAPVTNYAVPLTLSLATAAHYDVRDLKYNLVNLANRSGIRTAWLSNQGYLGVYDTTVTFIARQAGWAQWLHNDFFLPSDDRALLPLVSRTLAESSEQLVFVHLRGSHEQFVERYPRSAAVYLPDSAGDLESTTNSYDNSILYTDGTLEAVIAKLRNRNAVLVYYADHGLTQTREAPYLFHGLNRAVSQGTYEVPLVLWSSAHWRKANPVRWAELKGLAARPISTGSVFWITADLLGFERIKGIRPLDFLRRPPARIVVLGSDVQPVDFGTLGR